MYNHKVSHRQLWLSQNTLINHKIYLENFNKIKQYDSALHK